MHVFNSLMLKNSVVEIWIGIYKGTSDGSVACVQRYLPIFYWPEVIIFIDCSGEWCWMSWKLDTVHRKKRIINNKLLQLWYFVHKLRCRLSSVLVSCGMLYRESSLCWHFIAFCLLSICFKWCTLYTMPFLSHECTVVIHVYLETCLLSELYLYVDSYFWMSIGFSGYII